MTIQYVTFFPGSNKNYHSSTGCEPFHIQFEIFIHDNDLMLHVMKHH